MDSRVIEKCGYLKIKRPPTSGKVRIKAWQSKYFVIRDSPPTFEYFKDEPSFNSSRRTKDKNKIDLENVIYIGTTNASRTQRNAFMIVDSQHGAIMLATDSEQETKEWVDVLKRVSGKCGGEGEFSNIPASQSPQLDPRPVAKQTPESGRNASSPVVENSQGFPVTTRLTPSSEKIGIRDDYTMFITDGYVALHTVDINALVVQWPIIGLRGWKSEAAESAGRRGTQLLTLEAGRKSETGEGLFQFFTAYGIQIANAIRVHSNVLVTSAIAKRSRPSESMEDLPQDQFEKKPLTKAATDPRSTASHKKAVLTRQSPLTKRAESDSFIFGKDEPPNLSPNSLRSELSQERSTEEIAKDTSGRTSQGIGMQSAVNMYLDLIGDTDAESKHISDIQYLRKRSLDSLSLTSDEANGAHDCCDSYIDDSEINSYREEKDHKNKVMEQNDVFVTCSDSREIKSTDAQKPLQSTPQLCSDFLDQLSNPQAHQGSIFYFPEKHKSSHQIQKTTSKGSRDVIEDTSTGKTSQSTNEEETVTNQTKDVGATNVSNQSETSSTFIGPNKQSDSSQQTMQFHNFDQSKGAEESKTSSVVGIPKPRSQSNSLSLVAGREGTMDLLEKLVTNLETPQTPAKERLFPPTSKQFCHDHVASAPPNNNEVQAESLLKTEVAPKKLIEKSKSHCGFDSKQQTEKPPPLPLRPEMVAHARTKPSASLGDISKDLQRPVDGTKDIHRGLSPSCSFGVPSGPESVVNARILRRSTSGTSLGAVSESTVAQHSNLFSEKTTRTETCSRSRTRSVRNSGSFSPSPENESIAEDEIENKTRRSSKASKFISKVFNSLNPVDTIRRSSCDIIPNGSSFKDVDLTKGRSFSVASGIVNEAWSPDHSFDIPSPEGSPQIFKKSQLAARRASHDPNLDRRRNLFTSPTLENHRTKEEIRQRERAVERERERSGLPSEPPPRLPPRKKSDPPPIPPRLRQSSSDSSNCPSPNLKRMSQEQSSILTAESQAGTEDVAPPPVPPRRDDRRGSHPPAIQLTMSSPDEKPLSSIGFPKEEPACLSSSECASKSRQPMGDIVAKSTLLPHNLDESMSNPAPLRPPKSLGLWTAMGEDDRNTARRIKYENSDIRTTTQICAEFSSFEKTESSFVSIEMQEQTHSERKVITRRRTHDERLEIYDIERDSIAASTADVTNTGSHKILSGQTGASSESTGSMPPRGGSFSPQNNTGSAGRCSPGHTPPALALNLSPRSGRIVLADSPTTSISA